MLEVTSGQQLDARRLPFRGLRLPCSLDFGGERIADVSDRLEHER